MEVAIHANLVAPGCCPNLGRHRVRWCGGRPTRLVGQYITEGTTFPFALLNGVFEERFSASVIWRSDALTTGPHESAGGYLSAGAPGGQNRVFMRL